MDRVVFTKTGQALLEQFHVKEESCFKKKRQFNETSISKMMNYSLISHKDK
jgi:hypothetical protein